MQFHRSARLAAGTAIMFFSGFIYMWSILKAPLMAEFGWNSTQLGLNYTLVMSFFCAGNISAGVLLKKISARLSLLVGAVIAFAGFILASFIRGSLLHLYISYGVLGGLGIGLVYNVVLTAVTSWFPQKRATVSGVMMMGLGVSPLIMGPLANNIIRCLSWQVCYQILGGALLVVALTGCFFIDMNKQPPSPESRKSSDALELPPKDIIRRSSFWKIYVYCIIGTAIGGCIISLAKDIAIASGTSEAIAVTFVGALSVSNGLARLVFGSLFDVLGRCKTMLLASCSTILAMAVLLLAFCIRSVPLMFLAFVLVGLSYGSLPPTMSGFVSGAYGQTHFALNFSVANTMQIFASFSSTIGGVILINTGSYTPLFLLMLGCSVLMLVAALSIKRI